MLKMLENSLGDGVLYRYRRQDDGSDVEKMLYVLHGFWGAVRDVFEDAYKSFYLKYDEPSCVKFVKLRILPEIAAETIHSGRAGLRRKYAS